MLVASIITGIISFFLNSYYTGRHLGYSSWKQLKDVAPSYGVALAIALNVYFLKYLPFNEFLILFTQIIVGVVVFFAICNIFKLEEYAELKDIANDFIRRKKINTCQ